MIYQKHTKFLTGISLIITIPHEVASVFNSHFGNEVREVKELTKTTWLSGRIGVPMQEHSPWARTLHCCAWSLSRRYSLSHQVTWSLRCHGHVLSWLKSGIASLLLGPSKCAWLCLNPRLAQLRSPIGTSVGSIHSLISFSPESQDIGVIISRFTCPRSHS